MTILLATASTVIGLLIGISGVGGVLLIPALMFFGGLGTHTAMGTALFSFLFTGILATLAFRRHGSIDWGIALPVCLGSLISGYAGAFVNAFMSARTLSLLLAVLVICSSLYSMRPVKSVSMSDRLSRQGNRRLLLFIGLFTGFICGMTGAGGGIVSLPVMLICGYPVLASIGTAQVLQSIISVSGSFSNLSNGFIDFSLVWWVTVCELAGVFVGVKIVHMMPVGVIKKASGLLCLLMGLVIVVQALR